MGIFGIDLFDPTQTQTAQLQPFAAGVSPPGSTGGMFGQPAPTGGMSPWLRLALQTVAGGLAGSSGKNFGQGVAIGAQYGQQAQETARRNKYVDEQTQYLRGKTEAERRAEMQAADLQKRRDAYIATLPPEQQQMAALDPNAVIGAQVAQMFPKPTQQPDVVREYEYAKQQDPSIGNFDAWLQRTKKAGATQVSVGGPQVFIPKPLQAGPEQMAKEGASAYNQARDTLPLFDIALDAAKRFPQSGAGGNWSLAWQRGKNFLGLPNNAAAGETLQGIQTRLGSLQRLPGSGATSDMEMRMYMQAVPSLLNSQQGNVALATIGKRLAQRRMANYEGWAKHYMATGNPFDYQPDDSPVLTKEEANALLGAANSDAPASAPAAGSGRPTDDELLQKYGVQ